MQWADLMQRAAGDDGARARPPRVSPQTELKARTFCRGTGEPWEACEQGRGREALDPCGGWTGGGDWRLGGQGGGWGESTGEMEA